MPALQNARREAFAQEYLKDSNGSAAAIRAGYAPKAAKEQASRLLTVANVRERVQELRNDRFKALHMSAEETLALHAMIARADLRKAFAPNGALLPPSDLPDELAQAIASIEVVETMQASVDKDGEISHVPSYTKKVKLWDKTRALESLSKHHGLYEKDNKQAGAALMLQIVTLEVARKRATEALANA